MIKMVDERKELEVLKKKRLSYSFLIAAILLVSAIGCYLLIRFSKESYIPNLVGCIILTILAFFSLAFFLINFYPILNKRISFYAGMSKGEIVTSTIIYDSVEEEIENDKHLRLYPLNVEVLENLNRDEKVIFSFKKDVPFKKGKKYRVYTYQRVIIAWENA